jgi:hypothetical protein
MRSTTGKKAYTSSGRQAMRAHGMGSRHPDRCGVAYGGGDHKAESHIGVTCFGAHWDEAGRTATEALRLILLQCVELSQSPSI